MKSFKLYTGNEDETKNSDNNSTTVVGSSLVGLILLAGTIWYFWGSGFERQVSKNADTIYSQVSSDAVQQYEITKRNGNKTDICVQAGLVSAAYLQAKDEPNYQKWKQIENSDCSNSGINFK